MTQSLSRQLLASVTTVLTLVVLSACHADLPAKAQPAMTPRVAASAEFRALPLEGRNAEAVRAARSFAADVLRDLAEQRLITTPAVIPYLIEGLKHSNRHSIGVSSFQALSYLTLRRSGYGVLYPDGGPTSSFNKDEVKRAEAVAWWERWWRKNKNRHPVFDVEVEARTREAFLRVATLVEERIKPGFPEMAFYQVAPDVRVQYSNPIFGIDYDPSRDARWGSLGPPTRLSDAASRVVKPVWLHIHAGFGTSELKQGLYGEIHPPNLLRNLANPGSREIAQVMAERVLYQTLSGTDIVIEVRVATQNQRLLEAFRRALRSLPRS